MCWGSIASVAWVAGHGASADDEAFRDGSGDGDLGAELVAHPRLAFRDAIDLGFMQAVDLVLVFQLSDVSTHGTF